MAIDAEKKAELLKRVGDALDRDEKLVEIIETNRWEQFYGWLKQTCADIWDAIKDYASRAWDWLKDLFS